MRIDKFKTTKFAGVYWNNCSFYLVLVLLLPMPAMANMKQIETTNEELRRSRPAYINVGFGFGSSNFRDFATSPLIYSGVPFYTSLSHIDRDQNRESLINLAYSFGTYGIDYNRQQSESKVNSFSLNYLELFQWKKFCTDKRNIKFGGQFNATINLRNNEQLFNNSEGVDFISNVMGSVQTTFDLRQNKNTTRKFLFIKYKVQQRVRSLSYTLNVGLINSSYRNGFAYTSPSAPLNNDEFFAGYAFNLFNGFRINSTLDYSIFLENKNALQVSYLWDAYSTGGSHDTFEMASHVLKCSLLFRLK